MPAWQTPNYLGWQERTDGTWALGVHTLCGRIIDQGDSRIKSALRSIVQQFQVGVQLSADQDLILVGIRSEDRPRVEQILQESGYAWQSTSRIQDRALGCVALPTCGLAIAEAERVLATILTDIESQLEPLGLKNRAPIVRVTGCPNGCARPFAAEIGIVGQLPGKYALFLGGSPAGDRLARLWLQKIPQALIGETLAPVFARWKNEGSEGESFGDFVHRVGLENLATNP